MKKRTIAYSCFLILLITFSAVSSLAATRFVSGYRDGIWVYAVIERNGVQVRTDRMTSTWNGHVWDELSSADRMKLIKTYSWMNYRLKGDFGTRFTEINDFYNDESGWTALVEAMKSKHANKDFPDLAAFYDDPEGIDVPGVRAVCWEVRGSAQHIKANRLRNEILADYTIGKKIYQMLVDANWDQISIAVKALSQPLIETIVSNFITPFVTNGASAVSGLVATAFDFAKSLYGFIDTKYSSGQKPPNPARLIERLDVYIAQMQGAAENSISLITKKQAELQILIDSVNEMDEACLASRQQAAEQIRDPLFLSIETKPNAEFLNITADPVPDPLPAGYENESAWIYDNMRGKVWPLWAQLSADAGAIETELGNESEIVNDTYVLLQAEAEAINVDISFFENEVIPGYDGKYRYINTLLDEPEAWIDTAQFSRAEFPGIKADYEQVGSDAQTIIDDYLPRINPVDARALGLDQYAAYLGPAVGNPMNPLPSAWVDSQNLRTTLATMPEIIATPQEPLAEIIADFDIRDTLFETVISNIPPGVDLREEWMFEQCNKYTSLVFNFENSLSYIIATLNRIDQLYTDPYLKRADTPFTNYDGHELYRYSIDEAYILSEIDTAIASGSMAQVARSNALENLYELYNENQSLVQKLIIAQESHLNDAKELNDFFSALYAHYNNGTPNLIFSDIASVTGITLLGPYDLFINLVPNITFYYLGIDSWIRNESNLIIDMSAMKNISGLSDDYYAMLALYQYMEAEKSQILAMTISEFDAFMTQTTINHDLYKSRLTADGLFAPNWPAWQLSYATSNRQSVLNDLYRYGTVSEPYYWQVTGTVTTPEGQGVSGIDLVLDGHYGLDGSGAYVAFTTKSNAGGYFCFPIVSTGIFAIRTTGNSAAYISTPESTPVAVVNTDVVAIHTVVPTEESGYVLSGRVVDEQGQGVAAAVVNVVSESSGAVRTVLTSENGQYVMAELDSGIWNVYPAEQEKESSPIRYTRTVGPGESGLDFVLGPANDVFADINDDNTTDLKDLILALRLLSGQSAAIPNNTGDVNDDYRIGMEEVLAVLQVVGQ